MRPELPVFITKSKEYQSDKHSDAVFLYLTEHGQILVSRYHFHLLSNLHIHLNLALVTMVSYFTGHGQMTRYHLHWLVNVNKMIIKMICSFD